nr:hypothetical protein [Gemmatimonadota bacterium]NIO33366.1 hypothetical protein [Gemmatimonadota bacterium]
LGTEFGLYVTLDGGANWLKWEHGFPTASAMALVVHPREHDLVIGTHGRAVYIIDDIRPLRTISAATLAEPIHLFEIPDAIQYETNQSSGEGSPGHVEFRGENRPYGARISFSLNAEDLPRPGEMQAQQTGFGRGFGGGQQGAPGQRRRGPQVTVEISDADGEVIRTFRSPAHLGVNRITWNLRRDGFRRPSAGQQQQGFLPSGPDVLPGTYRVKVSYGDHEATGSVNVLPDPRYDIPIADREAKLAAIMYAGSLQEVVADAVERIRSTRTEVEAVLTKVRQGRQAGEPSELAEAGRQLNSALTDLEKKFWSPPGSGGQRVVRTDNVARLISRAYGSLGSTWDAPTQAQHYRLQQAEAMLQESLDEFNRLFAEDVTQFITQVEGAGLSFVQPKEPLTMPPR